MTEDQERFSTLRADDSELYVGFVDVLGFSSRIEEDFEGAVATYQRFLDAARGISDVHEGVRTQVYSDSILLTSPDLILLATAVQNLCWFVNQIAGCLIRGGIGFGRHAVQVDGPNTLGPVTK
jgi:hypothetical protein